jgi:NAD(P)-dependent dehydrogenase (short-subunit alcohol dehydrogenase family)
MTTSSIRTALVTGASRGIGRAAARAIAADGAYVIVHYGNSAGEAQALVKEIRAAGGKADAVGADLSKPEAAAALAEQVKALVGDGLDILVANAGIAGPSSIEEQTVAGFDDLYAINVRAPYFIVQQLLPLLGEGSSVILTSSLAVSKVVGQLSAYSATKAAVDTLAKHFAGALGPRGIRVNAIAPGVIETDMSSFAKSDEGKAFILSIQALKRIGQPEDVGDVIAFLASDKARWISGTTVSVDGGTIF